MKGIDLLLKSFNFLQFSLDSFRSFRLYLQNRVELFFFVVDKSNMLFDGLLEFSELIERVFHVSLPTNDLSLRTAPSSDQGLDENR